MTKIFLSLHRSVLAPTGRVASFLQQSSCPRAEQGYTGLATFRYDLDVSLNKMSKSDVIYFYFAKAFDSVSHNMILQKLKDNYEIHG